MSLIFEAEYVKPNRVNQKVSGRQGKGDWDTLFLRPTQQKWFVSSGYLEPGCKHRLGLLTAKTFFNPLYSSKLIQAS